MSDWRAAIICVGGPVRTIVAGSRLWHFEMHPYCGPMPIHKRTGNGIDGTRAFWDAVSLWAQQGERVDATGVCLWETPAPTPLYHLGGRHYTEDPKMAARFGVTTPVATLRGRRRKRADGPAPQAPAEDH